MLESLAAWVLRTYVGEYVENLNTDQLSIGYGTVELENLPLKKTALQGLELPIEVKSGFIGHLKLSIPFRHPKSEPWIIHINKLYLIAGPSTNQEYDENTEKVRERERKQKQLDLLEKQWQFGRSKTNVGESWWTSLYSSLSTTIMENLQLVITDVHVRYEDSVIDKENPFAIGITIGKLAVESANEKWEPEFLISESETKFKLIEIQKFSLYWDSDASLVGDLPSKDLDDALHRVIGRGQGTVSFSNHEYIVNPVSSKVKLQRNCSTIPLRNANEPRFVVDIHLEEIPITLSHLQYQSLSKLMKEFRRHFRGQKYRKWRPLCPKHNNAKQWWQFAGKCVLNFIQERNRRQTWSYVVERVRNIVKYVRVYTKHLTETIEDNQQKDIQAELEDHFTFEELKILRNIAVTNVKTEEDLRKAAEMKISQNQTISETDPNTGWLSGWWGWYGTSEDTSNNGQQPTIPSEIMNETPQTEEEEQFLEEIQENIVDDSIFKRDTVFAHLNFHLASGHFKLMTNSSNQCKLLPLIEIKYHDVRWRSEVSPRNSTWQSNVSLGSLDVTDKITDGCIFPYLVTAQSKFNHQDGSSSPKETESLFELQFRKMPKSSKVGYSLKIETRPLQVVYNPETIDRISEFFNKSSTENNDLNAIEQQMLDIAWARYEELKTQTKTGLYHAMDELLVGQVKTQDKRWDIDLSIAAPHIILPQSFHHRDSSMILLDLGHLSFKTKSGTAKTQNKKLQQIERDPVDMEDDSFVTPPSTPPSVEERSNENSLGDVKDFEDILTNESLADKIYDRYTLELADLRVLIANIKEYKKTQKKNNSDFTIVDNFTISLQLERRLVFTADPKWPSVTVSGDLSELNLYFSEIKVQAMWKCLAFLMRKSSTETKEEVPTLDLNASDVSRSMLDLTESGYYQLASNTDPTISATPSETSLDQKNKLGQLSEGSCLVLGQFCINKLSMYLSGRGRLIAELEVDGVKCSYTQRPYDMSLSLFVFDINLIDRVQAYGPEYDVLLSLQHSPLNGEQDTSPLPPKQSVINGPGSMNKVLILDETKDREDFDSVITLDYNQINPDSPSCNSSEAMRIASIQFSTMNVIANQETMAELLNFLNTLFPTNNDTASNSNQSLEIPEEHEDTSSPVTMEITATFHQLHLLFIRGYSLNNVKIGRKVADVSIIDLWTQVTLGDKQIIEGSLGGLHVQDVTPEDILHRDVLSVGCCKELPSRSMFQEPNEDTKKAFTFTLVKPQQLCDDSEDDTALSNHIRLSMHLASAHYTHTHRFTTELSLCVGDFSSYANDIGQSLKSAATNMAMSLVTKQTSLANNLDYISSSFTPKPGEPHRSRQGSMASLDSLEGFHDTMISSEVDTKVDKRRVYVHVTIETPVITLPRTASSSESLVAQLGRMVVYNTHLTSYDHNIDETQSFNDIDRLYIDITDMSLYSVGLRPKSASGCMNPDDGPNFDHSGDVLDTSFDGSGVGLNDGTPTTCGTSFSDSLRNGSESRLDNEEHILHDTALRLVVDRCSNTQPGVESSKPTMNISGRVTKPLQLVLSNSAYQQLLSTMDTLNGKNEEEQRSSLSSDLTSPLTSPLSSCYDFVPDGTSTTTMTAPPSITIEDTSNNHELVDSERDLPVERTPIRASFDIPEINIELKGLLKDGEQGIVNALFHDFELLYKNTEENLTCYDVSLGGLVVEDLLQSPESQYRQMMVSSPNFAKPSFMKLKRRNILSKSCPDISIPSNNDRCSTSLPLTSQRRSRNIRNFPGTSPLRPMIQLYHNTFATVTTQHEDQEEIEDSMLEFLGKKSSIKHDETLVKINVILVNKTSREYIEKYNKTDRFIEVDFNSLDSIVNLQTWVVFLEFFGIGKAPDDIPTPRQPHMVQLSDDTTKIEPPLSENVNSQFKIKVSSFSLTLNKAKYPLAKAKINGLSTVVNICDNNMSVVGKLMKINLMDMSPHGTLYKEKFTTCGDEALDFDVFRYGEQDPELRQDYDMKIKIRMSAVQYIHTKRFQSELMAFVTHFSQIQESLRQMRTVAAGNEVAAASTRATRISLDINAGTPLIVFPKCSESEDLLIANLGRLTLKNKFIFAEDEGSISQLIKQEIHNEDDIDIISEVPMQNDVTEAPCLLDHMVVNMVDIDLFTAVSFHDQSGTFSFKRQGNQLFKEKCKFDLMVERNLDWARTRAVPDMSIWGALSSIHVNLDYSQYGLILGFLNQNLGECLEAFERPSSYVEDVLQLPPSSNIKLWTTFKMIIDLVNVKLELLPSTSLHDVKTFIDPTMISLAQIDFLKCKFVYESFSDWSKTMDLVSQDVLLSDTRYKESSVRCFKEVLSPGRMSSNKIPCDMLMFEVHYRDCATRTTLTFIFNNSHITLILDAILDIYNFIMSNWDKKSTEPTSQANQASKNNITPPLTPENDAQPSFQLEESEKQPQKSFEMKLNISGSEFVVLENLDIEDSNAVVLRITAVLAWRPHYKSQKPLSCSVQSLEVFSCNLSCEEDSALSIIDPMAGLVELNTEERISKRKSQGLLDATLESLPSLEITLNSLNMRISYNDYKLFLSIFKSVSHQLSNAMNMSGSEESENHTDEGSMVNKQFLHAESIRRLQELGFEEKDCIRALNECHCDVESAATWLLVNVTPRHNLEPTSSNDNKSKLSGFQIRANSICICFIDDCGANDVPLVEFLLQSLYFWYELHGVGDSCAHGIITADYYNRGVSGWEPLVEPWKCQVHWQKQRKNGHPCESVLLKIDAADRLDLNITSSLIMITKNTLKSWSEDYYAPDFLDSEKRESNASITSRHDSIQNTGHDGQIKKRIPFVPFLIRNKTGCTLHFATVTSSPSKLVMTTTGLVFSGRVNTTNLNDSSKKLSEWRQVLPEEQKPFEFKQAREKQRHKETHELKVHQLVVQIEGWEEVSPVSVDKVGTFFRQALPSQHHHSATHGDTARIVFEISLENGAQKVVTVKSALVLKNKTDLHWEIKSNGNQSNPVMEPYSELSISLPNVQYPIFIRPKNTSTKFSREPLEWKNVCNNFENVGSFGECVSINGDHTNSYRYCFTIQRDGFPLENHHTKEQMIQPAHTITIIPPVIIVNLLPVELSYHITTPSLHGNIKPGLIAFIYKVNHTSSLEFRFTIENFLLCENLVIPELSKGFESCISHIELKDTRNRSLRLNVKIEMRPGKSLRISIFSSFWLVNNTGIPLVFKQEGSSLEMAGQFEEHEVARSLTPLLFSFSERDGSFKCQMRVGKRQHSDEGGKPVWCMPFSLEFPREFTRVHSRQPDRRPDIQVKQENAILKDIPHKRLKRSKSLNRKVRYEVNGGCTFHVVTRDKHVEDEEQGINLTTAKSRVYDVGIDVCFGQGRFRDTRIVTFAPRYQFQNKSSHTLAFQQRHFVREQDTRNPEGTLTSPPGAHVVWHWERTDLDQLLCIRLNDVANCRWSGGFQIDHDDSFHVSMRCQNGSLLFMRAEVMLKGAVYHIVFTDANQLPPPYRIDNMSEVPILFYQSRTEDHQRCLLQPKQSVAYAWDEPTLRREMTLGIVNDGSFVHFTLDKLGDIDELFYYNAIYIAFTHTFTSFDNTISGSFHLSPTTSAKTHFLSTDLVLDVPQGSAVILSKKEPYKRTQLWRMTATGILFNEGSCPPFDPRKPSSSRQGYVLDVAQADPSSAIKARKPLQLVLSKLSTKRKMYQTWSFTEDGRMKNQIKHYCVQPKQGSVGLLEGVDAILGYCGQSSSDSIPVEQRVDVQKLRPGSGMLLVRIFADGPTRTVRISDVRQQDDQFGKDWMVVERRDRLRETTLEGYTNDQFNKKTDIQIRLAGGIGISLINNLPEELVFAMFTPIELDYVTTNSLQTLDLSIGNIQIDDQLHITQYPVLLFVTPSNKEEISASNQPALSFSAAKEPTKLQNCEIFKYLEFSVRKLTLQIDERLLFKLLQFFGWVYNDDDININQDSDDLGIETQRSSTTVSTSSLKRYYFEKFLINALQLRVSIATVTKLPEDLKQIKSSLGLILVRLQDAVVDLESFSRTHGFDTRTALLDGLSKHYHEELRSQAPFILASVDFIGNPMGLFNDVSSGLEDLVRRGNVGGLFLNVAHGLSDSAAKLTGAISDGLWSASSDSKLLESREAMKAERTRQSSGDHLVTGVKGFGMGIVGGLTSIVTQPIEGASENGVPGFIQGVGKGILGTIVKPAAGVLDLASGLSAAVRGSATRSARLYQPKRVRNIRNCFGPGGAIPRFSKTNSEGQFIVLKLNGNNIDEKFITSESVRTDVDGKVKALLTNDKIYFVKTSGSPSPESILISMNFQDLLDCHHLKNGTVDYVELCRRHPEPPIRVRCEPSSAQKLVQKINYAKSLFEEVKQTVTMKTKESIT